MKLVIVESPTKAKTISHLLDKNFKIESSFGHVRDLPKYSLGVDVANGFEPHYVIPKGAKEYVEKIAARAKSADLIYYATDHDREGEAISWHLNELLRNKYKITAPSRRIAFHEITKEAVLEALKNPSDINQDLVDAQQARRILDRLVGYKLSPLLWEKVLRGLSAGRVQSVAVRLIVEREKEIKKFTPQEYWTIEGLFNPNPPKNDEEREDYLSFTAFLSLWNSKKVEKFDFTAKEQVENVVLELRQLQYSISEINEKEVKKKPYPPYRTSTLQQDGYNKCGFSSKETMFLAQQLYEGVELHGKKSVGLITYMRTDSVVLSDKFKTQAREFLKETLGAEYSFTTARFFKTKAKGAQEAHEAIRPTDIYRTPESIKSFLTSRQYKLYRLIWERSLASLMPEAILKKTVVEVMGTNKDSATLSTAIFHATGTKVAFDGFLKIYPLAINENELPPLEKNTPVYLLQTKEEQHFTEPPPRYTDATLVKELEKRGIGRPSTYAPIIDTIQKRNYVAKDDSKRFTATEIGTVVTELLEKHFSHIVDYDFTAEIENRLDEIAHKKTPWREVISSFYTPFEKNLEQKYKEIEKKSVIEEKTDIPCPKCANHTLIVKMGRFGKFLACPGFPKCKHTQPIETDNSSSVKNSENNALTSTCEKCNLAMLLKEGRYGKFFECPNYPKCKNRKHLYEKINMRCPECGEGEIVVKKTKKGRIFYGCDKYPNCTYASWKKPESNAEIKMQNAK